MSADAVQAVIGRAATDSSFRDTLISNPDEALQGYELTPEEMEALKNISEEHLKAFSESLDERISKGWATGGR